MGFWVELDLHDINKRKRVRNRMQGALEMSYFVQIKRFKLKDVIESFLIDRIKRLLEKFVCRSFVDYLV